MCKPNGEAAIPAECPHRGDCRLCPMLYAVADEETAERVDALVRQKPPTPHDRLTPASAGLGRASDKRSRRRMNAAL